MSSPFRSRLHQAWPAIATRLEQSNAAEARCVAVEAAKYAIRTTGLSDGRIDLALSMSSPTDAARTEVANLTDELDDVSWQLQAKAGESEEYTIAFRRARAAASVGYALHQDPIAAALEGLYEARAAAIDPSNLEVYIGALLGHCAEVPSE